MFGCWSPAYVEEENFFLFDNFDPMKLQSPSDLNSTSIEPHELHYSGVEREQKDQIYVKMEVSPIDILDGGQGEVGLEENEGGRDGDMMCVKPGLEDLNSELPNKEGIFEGESDEEGSTSLESKSENGDSSSDESSSDESMSAAKSLSSSEDEDGVGVKGKETGEEFEGKVREFDAHRIDFLCDEEVEGSKGPIRSKHEVEDLPPVPMVKVTLLPNHQLLPVGVISSVMGNRVIVEGSVMHNPLNEGSILWVMDTRLPLGVVDEIFGPVKNPYYIVRYNTEEEVPAGVRVGLAISFVAEFASLILNDKELYRKGYDASGENDEEVDNEVEFSDDEKEAECKKSLREGKRAINQCKGVKQEARFEGKRNNFMRPRAQHKDIQRRPTFAQLSKDQPHPTGLTPPQPAPLRCQSGIVPGSWSSPASATKADLTPPPTMPSATKADLTPPPTMPQYTQAMHGFNYLCNPSNQLLSQHQETQWLPGYSPLLQNTGLQGDLSMQLQNQNVVLNNIVNMMAFQQLIQQFVPHQGSIMPLVGAAPSPQPLGQNNFAPSPFSFGFTNVPGTPGLGNEIIQGQASLPLPPSVQFNGGSSTSHFNNGGSSRPHGRRPYQRGGGRLFNRGGRQPNR